MTTKFCLASDIHLDFGSLVLDNTENADCLILAGDIVQFSDLRVKDVTIFNWIDEFFKNISDQFKQVVWVPGNHEWYEGTLGKTINQARIYLEKNGWGNIRILDNESIIINDVPIHGTTLWTSMNNANPLALFVARQEMSDYKYIQKIYKDIEVMLQPVDTVDLHFEAVEYLKKALANNKAPTVVVTHHGPLKQCDSIVGSLHPAYTTDLSELILDNPHIHTWVFGHVHNRKIIECGNTKVISNCRGYKKYEAEFEKTFKPFYFEV